MLEIPESYNIAKQLNYSIKGKKISNVVVNVDSHDSFFYFENPNAYCDLLVGRIVGDITALSGLIEISVEEFKILLGEDVSVRYYVDGDLPKERYQLYVQFDDFSFIICRVRLRGGIWVFPDGEFDNFYYTVAKEKPSPLSSQFNDYYFNQLLRGTKRTISLKAFLATKQHIPGLGNGVLQDVLFNARLHPKSKLYSLAGRDTENLFNSIKNTIFDMATLGGRDTERDLFGQTGGYKTILSKKSFSYPCLVCNSRIVKQIYMGGIIYFCPLCQPEK